MTNKLSSLELEILEKIQKGEIKGSDHIYSHKAMIVFKDYNGEIQLGPCRWAYRNNYITDSERLDSWSVSPFPGCWVMIPLSRILRVRHIDAI